MDNQGILKKTLKLLTGDFFGSIISLLIIVLTARVLGPSDYGVLSISMVLPQVVILFFSFQVSDALTRSLTEYLEKNDSLRISVIISSSIVSEVLSKCVALVVILLLIPWLSLFTDAPETGARLMLLSTVGILLTVLNPIWLSINRERGRYWEISAIPTVEFAAHFLFIAVLSYYDDLTAINFLQALIAVRFIGCLWRVYSVKVAISHWYNIKFNISDFTQFWGKRDLVPGFWLQMKLGYATGCLSSLNKNIDIVAVGLFAGDSEVGWYRLARQLIDVVRKPATLFSFVLLQDFSRRISSGKVDTLLPWILQVTTKLSIAMILMFLTTFFIIENLIVYVFGNEYLSVSEYFLLLLPATCVAMAVAWSTPMLLGLKLFREHLKVNILVALIMVFGSFGFGVFYDPSYVAVNRMIAQMIGVLGMALIAVITLKKVAKENKEG